MQCSAIDGAVVACALQNNYLGTKKTWTRKIALITDGESPLELEEWKETVQSFNNNHVQMTIMFVFLARRARVLTISTVASILTRMMIMYSRRKTNQILNAATKNSIVNSSDFLTTVCLVHAHLHCKKLVDQTLRSPSRSCRELCLLWATIRHGKKRRFPFSFAPANAHPSLVQLAGANTPSCPN